MMRPDLLLLDQKWEPLTIAGGFPIRVGDMSALDHTLMTAATYMARRLFCDDHPIIARCQADGHETSRGLLPRGPRQLVTTLSDVGITDLVKTQPLMALVMGRSRYRERSRAEAIMSVVGATQRHLDKPVEQFRSAHAHRDMADMVCKLSPLTFETEVYQRAGANFFMWCHAVSAVCRTKGKKTDGTEVRLLGINRGSMMPFMQDTAGDGQFEIGPNKIFESNPPGFRLDLDDHPAVAGWEIQRDGSVRIPPAGIVASKYPPAQNSVGTPYDLPDVHFLIAGNSPINPGDPWAVMDVKASLVGRI